MRGRDYTALEAAVEHAVECGREREALDILWREHDLAVEQTDHRRMSAVAYLAQRLHDRPGWRYSGEVGRLIKAASSLGRLPDLS